MKNHNILKALILTAMLGAVSACNHHSYEESNTKEHGHSHEEVE